MIEPLMVSEVGIGTGMGADVVELVSHAGLVVKMVLLLLFFFSVVSWAIIIVKFRAFRAAEKESKSFLDLFWGTRNFSKAYLEAKRMLHSPIATMFRAGYADVEKIRKDLVPAGAPPQPANGEGQRRLAEELASIDRTLKRVAGTEITRLERTLTFWQPPATPPPSSGFSARCGASWTHSGRSASGVQPAWPLWRREFRKRSLPRRWASLPPSQRWWPTTIT